jgi:tetratricopeptide (TPR) repeat protein
MPFRVGHLDANGADVNRVRKSLLPMVMLAAMATASLGDPAADYVARGNAALAKGEASGAIADFTSAIAIISADPQQAASNPNFAVAYANRGAANLAIGNMDGAIADSTQAIELNPSLPNAFYVRAIAKQAEGDLDATIADCTKAIELNSAFANAYVFRGNAE